MIEIGNFKMLGTIIKNDYPVFSGFALERWFRQKFMESQNYVDIGGWWLPQSGDPEEIDIVTEDLEGNINVWEVKRQRKKLSLHFWRKRPVSCRARSSRAVIYESAAFLWKRCRKEIGALV